MFEALSDAFKALAPWPTAQILFMISVALLSVVALRRGERDRKAMMGNVEIPMYLMGGPVAEVFGAIHDIAEESRKTTAILKDVEQVMGDFNRGQEYTHRLLENILRNQELRPETAPVPPQRPVRSR